MVKYKWVEELYDKRPSYLYSLFAVPHTLCFRRKALFKDLSIRRQSFTRGLWEISLRLVGFQLV